MLNPFITAIRTLTIIPVPGKDTDSFSRSLPFFPVVGFLLGGVVSYLFTSAQYINLTQPLLIAAIALLIETLLTGALHIDGLGDVADGFGSRKSRDEVLAILKDSRMGAFGVCAIVFDILLKTVCWAELIKLKMIPVIILSLVISRSIQPLIIVFFPKAQKQSLLNSFNSSKVLTKISVIISFTAAIALCYLFIPVSYLIICTSTALIAAFLFAFWCLYKIGGITGDCVGAISEITEIVVVLAGIIIYNVVL